MKVAIRNCFPDVQERLSYEQRGFTVCMHRVPRKGKSGSDTYNILRFESKVGSLIRVESVVKGEGENSWYWPEKSDGRILLVSGSLERDTLFLTLFSCL